jgi:hypothetical protein
MDSSLHGSNLTTSELDTSKAVHQEEAERLEVEEEHQPHIHLPNPSYWPLILGAAILLTIIGLLFIPDNPWLVIIGIPCMLIGIMGWALEDPMAPRKPSFAVVPIDPAFLNSKFQIGQEVIDKDRQWVGVIKARLPHYILVERGGLFLKTYYIPEELTQETVRDNIIQLTVSEDELKARGLNSVPDDLIYEQPAGSEIPRVTGVPLYGRSPLSPAETGHYNYGPNYPGINTDASGSYRRDEVRPDPERYVGERRRVLAARRAARPSQG